MAVTDVSDNNYYEEASGHYESPGIYANIDPNGLLQGSQGSNSNNDYEDDEKDIVYTINDYEYGDTVALSNNGELVQYFSDLGDNNDQYLVDSNGNRVAYDENAPTMSEALSGSSSGSVSNQSSVPLTTGAGGKRSSTPSNIDSLKDVAVQEVQTRNHEDYWNSDFQNILDSTKDVDYDNLAKKLQSDVEFLSKDVLKSQDQITEWQGSAKNAVDAALNTINDKLNCVMDNIDSTIVPACAKIEDFKVKLEDLKKGKEELTGADGNGGLDKELEELTEDYNTKQAKCDELKRNEPPATTWDEEKQQNVTNGAHTTWQSNYSAAVSEADKAKQLMDDKQAEITKKETELDLLFDDVMSTYDTIKELVSTVNKFKNSVGAAKNNSANGVDIISNIDQMIANLDSLNLASDVDYSQKSQAVLADADFFEQACKAHEKEGWKIEGNIVTMVIDGTECTYDMKKHKFVGDYETLKNGKQKKVEIEAYFYLPSHIVESGDYSALENLDTYTFFTSNQKKYMNTINNTEINTLTMMVVKSDPMNSKYGAVANLTKAGNAIANTSEQCQNSIGGDSIYGAHSLKIAASNGDLYKTVYCVDNAAIVTGENGKKGTKEQFSSIDDLKGLDNKNIYFINTSGDDNYSTYADMSVERGRAYVPVSRTGNITQEQVKKSFTYSGIELVAQNCPNSKIHIVYQCEDTAKNYQKENFPPALDELASKYGNVWNDSDKWDEYARKKYKTHSEGNYIPHDLSGAESTIDPNFSNKYIISS